MFFLVSWSINITHEFCWCELSLQQWQSKSNEKIKNSLSKKAFGNDLTILFKTWLSGAEQYFLHSLFQLLNLFGIAADSLAWVSTRNKVWWWWWMHSHLLNTLLKQLTSSTHRSNVRFPLAFPVSHFLWTYIYICL